MPFVLFLGICVCEYVYVFAWLFAGSENAFNMNVSSLGNSILLACSYIGIDIDCCLALTLYTLNKQNNDIVCIEINIRKKSSGLEKCIDIISDRWCSLKMLRVSVDVHTNYHFIRLTEHLCRSSTKIDIMPKHIRHDCFHIVLILRYVVFNGFTQNRSLLTSVA